MYAGAPVMAGPRAKSPVFDLERRNQPPRCPECGGKMVGSFEERSRSQDQRTKTLVCIICGWSYALGYMHPSVKKQIEIKEEIDRRHRSEGGTYG